MGTADPVTARLLRYPTGLREGGHVPGYDVLATYWTRAEDRPFAFCRDGSLIDPGDDRIFVPFSEIEDVGDQHREKIKRLKLQLGAGISIPLTIKLRSGLAIELTLENRPDGMPDYLTIANLIRQRSKVFRPRLLPA